jgi:hypothetical protein
MAQRANYWSCSKFADWLRNVAGAPTKPNAGTSEEWRAYRKAARRHSKFFYWLADDGVDAVQNFIHWPTDKLYDFTYWICNRFVEKTHMLSTGLEPGYHEVEQRILYGLFNTLVVFVEEEKAWMEYICNSEKYPDLPFWKKRWPFKHFTHFTYPELGLKYLEWESTLKKDDEWFGYKWREKEEPEAVAAERAANEEYMKPTPQAEKAMEIISLYYWWKNDRPIRPDPYEISGWTAYCDQKRQKAKEEDDDDCMSIFDADRTPEEEQQSRTALDKITEIEVAQFDEDTEKMIQLIKLRQGLWT